MLITFIEIPAYKLHKFCYNFSCFIFSPVDFIVVVFYYFCILCHSQCYMYNNFISKLLLFEKPFFKKRSTIFKISIQMILSLWYWGNNENFSLPDFKSNNLQYIKNVLLLSMYKISHIFRKNSVHKTRQNTSLLSPNMSCFCFRK